jgi:hypothetical protein
VVVVVNGGVGVSLIITGISSLYPTADRDARLTISDGDVVFLFFATSTLFIGVANSGGI